MGCQKLNTDFCNVLEIIDPEKRHYAEKKCVNYYPFGLKHKGYNNTVNGQEYTYKQFQGQEVTNDFDLNIHEWKYRVSDPAIGRFWQVDPLAEDYVYNGVYNFSENRVIDGFELEGLEWVGVHTVNKNGSESIDYNVKIKVLNNSSLGTKDVQARSSNIKSAVESSYSGLSSNGVSINTNVTLEYVSSVDSNNDYYIEFTDRVEGGSSQKTVGKVNEIGNSQSNRIQVLSSLSDSDSTETAIHEVGHTVGLRHENDSQNPKEVKDSMGEDNIMNSTDFGNTIINFFQKTEIQNYIPTETQIEIQNNQYVKPVINENF